MILEGNERGFGQKLAWHLMNPKDNDHVTLHAIEGFIADDLFGAFGEAEAISQATQCSNYLFSLSLNPPENEVFSVEDFEKAIADIEERLGLVGQPRVIIFHEKNGRRHAHCVWSRINTVDMKAIELPHYKRKLFDMSRNFFLAYEWDMPDGFREKTSRDPNNYSREEHGQAKRAKCDPKITKAMFRQCWEQSDDLASFKAALREQGFLLARGDRRGFVAVDADGKIWSLSRWCEVKPHELRARLGSEEHLPSIEEILLQLENNELPKPVTQIPDAGFAFKRSELIARQRKERLELLKSQETRRIADLKARRSRLPKGLKAAFFKISGRYKQYLKEFDQQTQTLLKVERREQQALIDRHLVERRALEKETRVFGVAEDFHLTLKPTFEEDKAQSLELLPDVFPYSKAELLRNPVLVLEHVSKTKAHFERSDILTALAKRIDDPFLLSELSDKILQSPELVRLDTVSEKTARFTTRNYLQIRDRLEALAHEMLNTSGFGVSSQNRTHAIRAQNSKMKKAFGGKLSEEQQAAFEHVTGDHQLVCLVGLAGAGKSTLLEAANEAWTLQGLTVHGAALAGKAADGLEVASGIQSKTLASLETSWQNGYEPIKKGEVLVVDEAGMIGTRQLARIASKIHEIGAKLVLVGDPDQLQPIEAGTPFGDLVNTHDAANLTEIHRQREDWQKQASRNLAEGNISTSLESYEKHNAIKRGNTRDEAIEALVEAYAIDVAANGAEISRLAFAHRRKDVHALNQAIRHAIKDNAQDTETSDILLQTGTGKRAFNTGERIVFNRNDKTLGVKNGMLGTVQAVSETSIIVSLDGDPPRKLTFNPKRYQSFDHGYAVTIHKSQGATVDRSYVLASRSMDRHLAYVAMTRHREDMKLYVSERDRPRWATKSRTVEKEKHTLFKQRQFSKSGPSLS